MFDTADEGDLGNVLSGEEIFTTGKESPAPANPLQHSMEQSRQSLRKKHEMSLRIKRARERALKKLAPAPGWKPFGSPVKKKLDGKEW